MFKLSLQIVTLLIVFPFFGKGQVYLADVQFDRVGETAVKQFLNRQMKNNIHSFIDVKASLMPSESTAGYAFHEREYIYKDSLSKVWNHYLYTNPVDAWNAQKLDFGILFSKKHNELFYPDQQVDKIEPGQLVYLNLNVLQGVKKLCAAFEIITVDEVTGIIEFSYVEDNLTRGKQQLRFVETPKGHTKIIHRSYFKSKSILRDHFIYPYFHTRLTNNYHRNMKRIFKAGK